MYMFKTREAGISLILACLSVLMLILFFAAGGMRRRAYSNVRSGALMNARYEHDLASLRAEGGGLMVECLKRGDFWIASGELDGESLSFPSSQAGRLIADLVETRDLFMVSPSSQSAAAYGLDDAEGLHITAMSTDGETAAALVFGNENRSLLRRAVRSQAAQGIYEVDAAPFTGLSADLARWADYELIPSLSGITNADAVQGLRLEAGGGLLTRDRSAAADLIPLRGGGLAAKGSAQSGSLLFTVRLEAGDGSITLLSCFSHPSDPDSFFIVPTVRPGPAWTADRIQAASELSYALEISGWTYNRLRSIMQY